jgi:SAM-dependent methyltransferase
VALEAASLKYIRGMVRRAHPYDERWFERRVRSTRASADVIAPFVSNIVSPESIVDLGCGTGSWLAAFAVDDCLGVDGGWIRRHLLEIPAENFVEHDLTRPFSIARTFDLALSIEVGEHLPAEAADVLVESLVGLAPVVLFSAAIPFQGGTDHVNPQWPSYWAEKFRAHGYSGCDVVRPAFWSHPNVRFFHAQNLVLYVRDDQLQRLGLHETAVLPLVHPRLLERIAARPRVWRRVTELVARASREIVAAARTRPSRGRR